MKLTNFEKKFFIENFVKKYLIISDPNKINIGQSPNGLCHKISAKIDKIIIEVKDAFLASTISHANIKHISKSGVSINVVSVEIGAIGRIINKIPKKKITYAL